MTTAKSSPAVSTMMWRLRPDTLLPASSPWSPFFSGPHRLAVYDGLAGSGIPSLALPDLGAQRLLNPLPSAIGPPFSEVPPDHTQGGRSWGIIRQGMPPRSTYRMLFTTRRFTVRGCPLDEFGGSRGSSKPHWHRSNLWDTLLGPYPKATGHIHITPNYFNAGLDNCHSL